ncbi:MAG: helix-hairpin-helix domain-containing protein [Chthoniobacterales bacterium]
MKSWLARIFFLLLLASIARADDWMTLRNCRYLPNAANDGDSFHVQADGKEYVFRLYFVDTPETDVSIPARVSDQAKYFAVTVPQTLQIGTEAERFTKQKLARPFTVRTCLQDARGRSQLPRYFAFVETESSDLGEALVANGLARVYGAASEAPSMNTPEVEWRKLQELERTAKTQKVGGWGIGSGRLNTRNTTQPRASATSFDAFFHPHATPAARAASTGGKLDVNTATLEELQAVPGIGLVLAKRIIAARPFGSADGLRQVKGVGTKRFAELRPCFR